MIIKSKSVLLVSMFFAILTFSTSTISYSGPNTFTMSELKFETSSETLTAELLPAAVVNREVQNVTLDGIFTEFDYPVIKTPFVKIPEEVTKRRVRCKVTIKDQDNERKITFTLPRVRVETKNGKLEVVKPSNRSIKFRGTSATGALVRGTITLNKPKKLVKISGNGKQISFKFVASAIEALKNLEEGTNIEFLRNFEEPGHYDFIIEFDGISLAVEGPPEVNFDKISGSFEVVE